MLKSSTNNSDSSKLNILLDVAEKISLTNPDVSTPSINSKRVKISNAPEDLMPLELERQLLQANQTIDKLKEDLKAEKNHNNICHNVIKVMESERNNLEEQLKAEQTTLRALQTDFSKLTRSNDECRQRLEFMYKSQRQIVRADLEMQFGSSQNELTQQRHRAQIQALQCQFNLGTAQKTLSTHISTMSSLSPSPAPVLFQSYSGVFTTRQSGFQTNSYSQPSFKPNNRSL